MVKLTLDEFDFKRLEKAVYDSVELSEKIASLQKTREAWNEAHAWLELYKKLKTCIEINGAKRVSGDHQNLKSVNSG